MSFCENIDQSSNDLILGSSCRFPALMSVIGNGDLAFMVHRNILSLMCDSLGYIYTYLVYKNCPFCSWKAAQYLQGSSFVIVLAGATYHIIYWNHSFFHLLLLYKNGSRFYCFTR